MSSSSTSVPDLAPAVPGPVGSPTPSAVLAELDAGNHRFVTGSPIRRVTTAAELAEAARPQRPRAVIFGCSDSRVPAEIIFDQSIGEVFVVRTAGHVTDSAVLGSIEYAVAELGVPLIVVLGHDHCGAVALAEQTLHAGSPAPGHLGELAEKIIPGIVDADADDAGAAHVRYTVAALPRRSSVLAAAIDEGRCAIVGMEYTMTQGAAHQVCAVGELSGRATDTDPALGS